jgi:DNA-directed RNA polymerase specialized sigma24 family protein
VTYLDELKPLVELAAAATVRKWPSYVSAEDVQQEIWIWALEKESSITTAIKAGDWEAKVYSTMLRVASTSAAKEDRATNGYSKDDTYVYSVAVIETLLESAFTYEDWQSFGSFGDGQPHAKGQVNETGDVLAMLSDVKAGLAELKAEYREVLFLRYGMHWTHERAGEHLSVTARAAEGRHRRAIKALREVLGKVDLSDLQSGWSERREAMGNERSQILTGRAYEG